MPHTKKMIDLRHMLALCLAFFAIQAPTTQGLSCPSPCSCTEDFYKIDCSNAELTTVPDLSSFREINIATLDLSQNDGLLLNEDGKFDGLNINILKLSSCGVQTIKEGVFQGASVTVLYLDHNPITFLPENMPFKGLENSLQYLILQNIQLEKFPVKQLEPLKVLVDLDISYNAISTINKSDLKLFRAKRMYMNNNKLTSIHKDSFNKMPFVEHLDLSSNEISDASFLWHICKFKEVNLSGNPLDCDCDFVKYRKFETNESYSGTCHTPTAMQGLQIGSEEFIKTGSKECSVGGVPAVECYLHGGSHEIYLEDLSYNLKPKTGHLKTDANSSNLIHLNLSLLLLTVFYTLNIV